jgi:hypothetical protein
MPNELRDVEFDIALGAGRPLTVSATPQGRERGTRFFIPSQNRWATQVTFPEGRPFRIQVPRDYLGHLLIQQGTTRIIQLQLRGLIPHPQSLEPVRYRLRPAGTASTGNRLAPPAMQPIAADRTRVALPRPSQTPPEGYDLIIKRIQGPPTLQAGPYNFNTLSSRDRHWVLRLVYGTELPEAARGLYDARNVLRDFDARFYIKREANGAHSIIFRGYAGLRRFLTNPNYGAGNKKVVSITGGGGTVRTGAASGLRNLGTRSSAVTLIFIGIMDFAEWFEDGDKPVTDLLVDLGLDVIKATVGAAIASGIMAGLMGLAAGVAIPLAAAVMGGIVLGLAVGLVLDQVDQRLGVGDGLKRGARDTVKAWENFMLELQHGLRDMERWMMTGGRQVPGFR